MSDNENEQWATPANTTDALPEHEPLAPVLLAIAPPAPQSRLTVLVRLILVIPHAFALLVLEIVGLVLLVIGWFGALFTGRLPDFAADFLTGLLRWQARVYAYGMLLTDKYPPFTMDDADYPVRVAVRPGSLNRLAVLFRFFLLIPVQVVQDLLSYGALTIMAFISWCIVLITGRLPDAMHQALSAVLRYQTRIEGYSFMLTSAYPGGLLGDMPPAFGVPAAPAAPGAPAAPAAPGAAAEPATPGEPTAPGEPAAFGEPGGATAGGEPTAFGEPATFGEPAATTDPWLLVLSSTAKGLVIFYIVFGALLVVVQNVATFVLNHNAITNSQAASTIQTDFAPVNNALAAYQSNFQNCNDQLSCITALDRSLGAKITMFAGQLSSVQASGSRATQAVSNLEAAATNAAAALNVDGSATTAAQYNSESLAAGHAVGTLINAFNSAGPALGAS